MTTVDEYLATLPLPQKTELERIRRIIKVFLPGAEEVISYDMPAIKYNHEYVMWFAAFDGYMNIFPGNIKFTVAEPLSEFEIKEIIAERISAISKLK